MKTKKKFSPMDIANHVAGKASQMEAARSNKKPLDKVLDDDGDEDMEPAKNPAKKKSPFAKKTNVPM